jgi:Methyltransferase small domain
MNLTEQVRSQAMQILSQETLSPDHFNNVLRLMAKYRALLIQNTVVKLHGVTVQAGPFAGLEFIDASTEGCHVPKLLGCYEWELHEIVEAIVATDYDDIVNIGCAEGYYAIGLARRCSNVRIHAYDTNPKAQEVCRELARRNGVEEQVRIAGLFSPDTFREFQGRRTLFIIDIEGNELELLEAISTDELANFDFLIECHDCFKPGICDRLAQRFAHTHLKKIVKHQVGNVELPRLFDQLGHLDYLLAVWEWRMGPTPWLVAVSHQSKDSALRQMLIRDI